MAEKMILIRFIGNGEDDNIRTDVLHLKGCSTDHTLCGDSLDFDKSTVGEYEYIEAKKVTCPECARIIRHCRGAKI